MSKHDFGGNLIRKVDINKAGYHPFTDNPYFFFHFKGSSAFDRLSPIGAVTIYILDAHPGAELHAGKKTHALKTGDVIQLENAGPSEIKPGGGEIEFFAAGQMKTAAREPLVHVSRFEQVKKVEKPWGHELWLNGEHPEYAFKKLFIKAGTRTSLQYHKHKRETMIFCDGQAALHYKSNPQAELDSVQASDVSAQGLVRGDLVDVMPLHLHRVEAVSDIVLFEVSTPHLDDVIRVSDDSKRVNGRIAKEHKAS